MPTREQGDVIIRPLKSKVESLMCPALVGAGAWWLARAHTEFGDAHARCITAVRAAPTVPG